MAKQKQGNGLEIDDDINFHRKEATVERVGWTVMALLALLGLVGLFGDGPLARTRAASGPVEVQYDRFERLLSPAQMVIHVAPEAAQNDEIRLQIERNLLNGLEVRGISPQPDSMELAPDRVVYVFKLTDPSRPMQITFDMETVKAGSHIGQVGVDNGALVRVNQFIYP